MDELLSSSSAPVDYSAALLLLAAHTPSPSTQRALPSLVTFDQDPPSSILSRLAPLPSTSISPPSPVAWIEATVAAALLPSALAVLASSVSDEDAVQSLVDLLGFDAVETISELISHRTALALSASVPEPALHALPHLNHSQPPHQNQHSNSRAGAGYAPQAQVTFQSAEELAQAKRARKLGRHALKDKGKAKGDDFDELDLDTLRRIRNDELARGPGDLVSGNRVRLSCELGLGLAVC